MLAFASLAILLLLLSSSLTTILPVANAMGPPANSCPNLYAATFTSAIVSYRDFYGNKVDVNVLTHPNATVSVATNASYNITILIQTPSKNTQATTDNGTLWVHDDFYYLRGECI